MYDRASRAETSAMFVLKIEVRSSDRNRLEDDLDLILKKVQAGFQRGHDARAVPDSETESYDFVIEETA